MLNSDELNYQLDHAETANHQLSKNIVVISDNIRTPENIGMLFRTCEAFGVKSVYICGQSPNLSNKKVQRTSRNTHKTIHSYFYEDATECINSVQSKGYTLVALELTKQSIPIQQFQFQNTQNIALIIGSERYGINANILKLIPHAVYIPMFGKNSSINVINALTAALYEISRSSNL